MTKRPHASWAEVYDLAYERTFGGLYHGLTEATLAWITKTVPAPARIVDFGAGTGRLSLPLSRAGYRVTAVDPSAEMLAQMRGKEPQALVETACMRMEEFKG
ncbi:MAG: class I SAM-dependent methyltransferase, partial [Verrucomicrobiia bacterium]